MEQVYIILPQSLQYYRFVTFFVNLYIAKPDKYTTTAMNIFIQFVNDRLNILNISGAYAVNGL